MHDVYTDARRLRGPLVSIVVAVHNVAGTIQRCIDSVIGQDYQDVELVIVDGASTDGTVEILQRNSGVIVWESEPDNGVYDAWNKALTRTHGEWICFLGADDYLWNPRVLSEMVPYLGRAQAEGVNLVYGKVALVTRQGDVRRMKGSPWEEVRERFHWEMCIPHPGMFHHKSLFDRHGQFDNSYKIAGDYEFLMRELKSGEARFVPEVVTTGFEDGGMSNRPDLAVTALKEMARVRRSYNLHAPLGKRITANYLKIYLSILLFKMFGRGGARGVIALYRKMRGLAR